ncbi:MAG: hypothetical protein JWM10_2400, partial [Myxococcaceae bacterium]|nr:hypothetical protein [Myxococcaceae bacterium]
MTAVRRYLASARPPLIVCAVMKTSRSPWKTALWAALLGAVAAGCGSGSSVIGGPADAAVANDLGADVTADLGADVAADLGAPIDAAPDAAPDAAA